MKNKTPHPRRIAGEAIAGKIALLRNFHTPNFAAQVKQHPRMLELLWFLQWHSMQPGGLLAFVQAFLEVFAARIGTPAMRRLGQKALTQADRQAILAEIPRYRRQARTPAGAAAAEFFHARAQWDADGYEPARDDADFADMDLPGFRALCAQAALNDLPGHLAHFCALPDEPETLLDNHWNEDERSAVAGEDRCLDGVWYLDDLPGALMETLDVHARRESAKLAQTATAGKVSDALQLALEESCAVAVEGDTRFGKTHSVTVKANMRPGVFRVIRTPCSNVFFDLLRAIAEAVGIEIPLGMCRRELQRKIELVIQFGGLVFIFDEAHYLFPRSVSLNTEPVRLNFIREQIMDRRCPLALISTPQEFAHSLQRFVKTTHHNIAQFMGRITKTVILPNELADADLLNVAKLHFPDLPEAHLELIAAKALQTEKFLMTVESLAKCVRYIARKAHHATPTLGDLDQAIAEVIGPAPTAPAVAPPRPVPTVADRRQACQAVWRTPPAPPRQTAPALETV